MLDSWYAPKLVYTNRTKHSKDSTTQHKNMFSSAVGHSGAHWSKLRTTFGFSRTYNCNKIYTVELGLRPGPIWAGFGQTGLLKTGFNTKRFHSVWVTSKTGLNRVITRVLKKMG